MARPVFVLGAARSGTTLVQRLLNSFDDTLIWGEHAGIVRELAQAYYRGREEPNLFRHARPLSDVLAASDPIGDWQAWLTWFVPTDWDAAFRRIVETLFVPPGVEAKRVWGFKEVRHVPGPGDRTIDFLHALYPAALFVFVVRNPLNVLASSRRRPGGPRSPRALVAAADEFAARYGAYARWRAAHPRESFWVRYEDVLEQRGGLLELLAALDRPFGARQLAVLQAESGRGSSFREGDVHARWRALPLLGRSAAFAALEASLPELGYDAPPVGLAARALGRGLLPVLRAAPGRDGGRRTKDAAVLGARPAAQAQTRS